ncbi:glucan biosynthesis protein [Rhodoligotrophos defluvii]|uniref:glucan biosynthesis protein n=1 Tax=Rhodoligotrophos defluvii TaxID=2561934 RepID=UPI0010C9A3BE|nr:glucan biosynthesis protein D [Rhodoligotrophos defluvii]
MSANRREVLAGFLAGVLGFTALAPRPGQAAADGPFLGTPKPFSFDDLKDQARRLAASPWQDPRSQFSEILERIDYDAFQKIVFRRDASLFSSRDDAPPVQLFHLGRYFQEPCSIAVVENGQAREIHYRKSYFDMPDDHVARKLPDDIGFAGFRVMAPSQKTDWLAFLGAAYFRSSGALDQYGLSARGVAIDTALPTPEEFPRFTGFWLESGGTPDRIIIYALMDGPSIAGAFRMNCQKDGGVIMDIDASLHPRKPIKRLGVAPLTSMFWYGENDRRQAVEWRPEIHDSDGLAMWTGTGERIWRPLNNPRRVMTNSFLDKDPRGFGLLQRDRNFDHYQDDGVFYDKRPSVWVEPKGGWGEGEVQLVEIPTEDEIHDNIVAYWVPRQPAVPGTPLDFSYRLHWVADEPFSAGLGRAVDTFSGIGGIPGQPRPPGVTKFVVDFEGGDLKRYQRGEIDAVVNLSRGELGLFDAYPLANNPGRFRAFFNVKAEGGEPVDIRLYLRSKAGGDALTETWLYQFFPISSSA